MIMANPAPVDFDRSSPVDQLTFEQAFNELENIVGVLESGEHTLDASLALFERGQELARYCAALLDKAELKVRQLSGEELVDFGLSSE
jgi:exodeoxyribonuclease VII small subunit